ncbi:MAG: outer membrane lipoprotein carrier protein LolA [Nitrospinae bacterium]|nr:outer membrane lipoprotein carrier protein LolA [Nitrospinota bacterium]
MTWRLSGPLALALTLFCWTAQVIHASETETVAERAQKAFDSIRSMKAGFKQVFENKGFGQSAQLRGTVYILKPARMLWVYDEPKGRILAADGESLWFYDPAENVAYHDEIKGLLSEKSPALFLAGEKTLSGLFTIDLVKLGKMDKLNDVVRLKLTPKSPHPGVKAMLLTLDASSFDIVELLMVDHLGNKNRISFFNEDQGFVPDESIFAFTPPEGAPVRSMKGRAPVQ